MRVLKIAGWIVAGLLGLLVAVALLTWVLFDPNDHKSQIQAAFRDATGRDLRLDGRLELSVVPWLAVESGAASISNRPGFGDQPFAAFEHARLGVRIWPLLLSRRLEFGPARVEGLRVHLEVARDGSNNWSDLVERMQPKAAPDTGDRSPDDDTGESSIAKLELEDAHLSFDDAQAGTSYAIEQWDLRTGKLHRTTPFEVETSLNVVRDRAPVGRIQLQTRVDPATAGLLAFGPSTGNLTLPRTSGKALELGLAAPSITIEDDSRKIAVDSLEVRLGDARLVTAFAITQGSQGPQVDGRFELAETSLRALLATLAIEAPRTRDANVLRTVATRGKVRYSGDGGLQLDELTAVVDDTRLRGRVTVTDLDRMALRFELAGDAIDVDRYLSPPASKSAASAADGSTANAATPDRDAKSDDAGTSSRDVAGSLTLDRLTVAAIALTDVRAALRLHDRKLALEPLRATAFGGRSTTRLEYDAAPRIPTLRVEQRLEGVDVAALLGTIAKSRQLQGRGDATFTLTTRGADGTALVSNLSGPFDVEVTNGAVIGVDVGYEIQRAIAVAKIKGTAGTAKDTGRTPFERFAARGTLRNRTLANDRMEFVSNVARVQGHGDVDYGRNRLDLALKAHLLALPSDDILGIKLSRLQNTPIPLTVGGTLQKPKVRPDVSKLLESATKDAVKKPLEDEIRKQLEKLLGH